MIKYFLIWFTGLSAVQTFQYILNILVEHLGESTLNTPGGESNEQIFMKSRWEFTLKVTEYCKGHNVL